MIIIQEIGEDLIGVGADDKVYKGIFLDQLFLGPLSHASKDADFTIGTAVLPVGQRGQPSQSPLFGMRTDGTGVDQGNRCIFKLINH